MIPDRYLQPCQKVQARGVTTDAFISALREQHVQVDDCNDRLDKARAAQKDRP